MSKVEHVAKAICFGAGKSVNKVYCITCQDNVCTMWKEVKEEARLAIKAMDDYKEIKDK